MCGINFLFSGKKLEGSVIRQMNDKIRHRGPDDSGYIGLDSSTSSPIEYSDSDSQNQTFPKVDNPENAHQLWMAHRRLSILDTSPAGHQPFHYQDLYWIIFNGEIYNFIELKGELEAKGYTFRTSSDTEVILAAYDHWGTDCVKHFNGMWAFIVLDIRTNSLFISRDRFGIKPLYFYQKDDLLAFCSEIKSLTDLPVFEKQPNHTFLQKFLDGIKNEVRFETAFEEVYCVPPGTTCTIALENGAQSHLQFTPYWNTTPNTTKEKYSDEKLNSLTAKYFNLLQDAVKLRLRADVKVGSALSGGIDSSSVVYLVNTLLKEQAGTTEKQNTFSNVYKTKEALNCDESIFIDEVANALSVKNHKISPDDDEVISIHEKIVYHMDNPINGSIVSAWHTYKLVRDEGVTVTLDGQGADEQLAGYLPYIGSFLLMSSASFKEDYQKFLPVLPPYLAKKLKRLYWASKFIPAWMLRIAGEKKGLMFNHFKALNRLLDEHVKTTLVDLFMQADRMSMAHSVESRLPFMDYRLVEFLGDVPATYKMHDGWTKFLSRAAFKDKLPDTITWRKDKLGWANPEEYWFRQLHKDHVQQVIRQSDFLDQFPKSKQAKQSIKNLPLLSIMRLYNLAVWHNTFFSEKSA